MDITEDQVLAAASTSTTVTEVARRLGLCGKTLSGLTAKNIRALAPGLDGILEANKKVQSTESEGQFRKVSGIDTNPYGRGLYRELFRLGSSRYWRKEDLISAVAKATGKSLACVGYAYSVLASRQGRHSSNNGKSTSITDDNGMVKLIALKRRG